MDIFDYHAQKAADGERPLAERMRPRTLDEFAGQTPVAGDGGLIRRAVEDDRIFSMILWGPPGCGKTTLARIIANETRSHFTHFSAVLSGVKEIRTVIEAARNQRKIYRKRTILFVDEIHRFNKAQQDAFFAPCGERTADPDRRDDGESLFRGHFAAFVQVPGRHLSPAVRRRHRADFGFGAPGPRAGFGANARAVGS